MKEKNGEHPFGDTGQLISLGIFMAVWIVDSFILRQSTVLSNYLPLYIRLAIFGILFIIAIYLFRSGHVVVHHEKRNKALVATGAFNYVRHPLYLASMLTYLGLAVSTLSLFSIVVLIGIFIFHNHIASYEEKLMETKFKEEYRKYKKKTGKWLPRI